MFEAGDVGAEEVDDGGDLFGAAGEFYSDAVRPRMRLEIQRRKSGAGEREENLGDGDDRAEITLDIMERKDNGGRLGLCVVGQAVGSDRTSDFCGTRAVDDGFDGHIVEFRDRAVSATGLIK